ncbi:unnamed protein product, partial [Mesorhabditis spiculigera]
MNSGAPDRQIPLAPNTRVFGHIDRQIDINRIVVPGFPVSSTGEFMRGHGTYFRNGELHASLAGSVRQVNQLINVQSIKQRYSPEVGDVIVGSITEVQDKRWKVDINSRSDGHLLLASVNLPGGELRRKTVEDELAMRDYLVEGDFISAEVQQVHHDGACFLHTRNLKYGKLGLGLAVKVPSYLIKRRKAHFHSLPCGVGVIIGCNGMIWLCEQISEDVDGGYNIDLAARVPEETLRVIARLHNCIRLLANHGIHIFETSIMFCYDLSKSHGTQELLRNDLAAELADQVIQQLRAGMEE